MRGGSVEENFKSGRELEILVWTGGGEMEVSPTYFALRVWKNDTTQERMATGKPND